METIPDLYPLTGLQIGDIQSYVSQAFLYFSPVSRSILIFVDNRPWMLNMYSKSAKIWQLMVTKYRISPFTNNKKILKSSINKSKSKSNSFRSNHSSSKWSQRWLPPIIDSVKWQEKYIIPAMDLSKALHGFIIFEVAWKDVHGINYINELQVDATLALEVKFMRKWEFYSPKQALSSISSWFSGGLSEIQSLERNLRLLFDLDMQQWNPHCSSLEMLLRGSFSPDDLTEDEDFVDVLDSPSSSKNKLSHITVGFDHDAFCRGMDEEALSSPTQYKDKLMLFRFSDCVLPVKLQHVIMSDLRLLTLLEAGLPSWVIFFQSYPFFCNFYRPWVRHFARTLYILISLITVIIGFYDLYKNVPLLKAAASRLCGPLFGWIEEWDMLSRIHYLGTMLFLQNFEKGLKWFLIFVKMTRTVILGITRPLISPLSEVFNFLSPLWGAFAGLGEMIYSTIWLSFQFFYVTILNFIESILLPFELVFSYIYHIVILVQKFLCVVRDMFIVPFQCAVALANYMSSFFSEISFIEIWESGSRLFNFTSMPNSKQASYDISMLQSIWNDLLSQIFRAIRSIINVLMAFFIACNRHRLSTYNHLRAYTGRLFYFLGRVPPYRCRCAQTAVIERHIEGDNNTDCSRCK